MKAGEIAAAHVVAFGAIDRFHDGTFDNIVSGEKSRDFAFERGSVSVFINTSYLLVFDPARKGRSLERLREIHLRIAEDRAYVYRHAPADARSWVDTAVACLLLLRLAAGELSSEEAGAAARDLAATAAAPPIGVPPAFLGDGGSPHLRALTAGEFDPLRFAHTMPGASASALPALASGREAFVADMRRMASSNLHVWGGRKEKRALAAVEPDIEAGAVFVNLFEVKGQPLLIVTNFAVWLLVGRRPKRIPLDDIEDVDVERHPFRNCVGIRLVVRGRSGSIDYEFAFECFHGFEDPAAHERLRIAQHNAEVAATEIRTHWRR
jgi:hypothetical protein